VDRRREGHARWLHPRRDAAAAEPSSIVAELYSDSPASATTEFMVFIFGTKTPG
jgi:hypothetical protein